MPYKHRFTVYLAKEDVEDVNELLTEKALHLLDRDDSFEYSQENEDFETEYDDCWLFIISGIRKPPKWRSRINQLVNLPAQVKNQHPSALFVILYADRFFIITLGSAYHYIDQRKVARDFGLKVTVNLISDEYVKSVQKTTISASQNSINQAFSDQSIRDFSESDVLDIIKKISGRIESEGRGNYFTGSTALNFPSENSIENLSEDLDKFLDLSNSKAYQSTKFSIIDKIAPVLDIEILDELNAKLADALEDSSDEFELSIPDSLTRDMDISYCKLSNLDSNDPLISLNMSQYVELAKKKEGSIGLEKLKYHKISSYDESGTLIAQSSIYNCILGTIELTDSKYVINEGRWYLVNDDYKERVDKFFKEIRIDDDIFPQFETVEAKKPGKRGGATTGLEAEATYNARVAEENGYINMDTKDVPVPGEPGRGLEFCDWLDLEEKRLIHVKKSSRQSSILSHFFNQGSTPLQLFLRDTDFRKGVIEKVAEVGGDSDADEFDEIDPTDWNVLFVIADKPRENGEHNIPFFSRVTLFEKSRDWYNRVNSVGITFITQEDGDQDDGS